MSIKHLLTREELLQIHSEVFKKYKIDLGKKKVQSKKSTAVAETIEMKYGFGEGKDATTSLYEILNEDKRVLAYYDDIKAKKSKENGIHTENGEALKYKTKPLYIMYKKMTDHPDIEIETVTSAFIDPLLRYLGCNSLEQFRGEYPCLTQTCTYIAYYHNRMENEPDSFRVEISLPAYKDENLIHVVMWGFHSKFRDEKFIGEGMAEILPTKNNWIVHLRGKNRNLRIDIPSNLISAEDLLNKPNGFRIFLDGTNSNDSPFNTVCTLIPESAPAEELLKAKYYHSVERNHSTLEIGDIYDGDKLKFQIGNTLITDLMKMAGKTYRILNKVKGDKYCQSRLCFDHNLVGKIITGFVKDSHKVQLKVLNNVQESLLFEVTDERRHAQLHAYLPVLGLSSSSNLIKGSFVSMHKGNHRSGDFCMKEDNSEFSADFYTPGEILKEKNSILTELYTGLTQQPETKRKMNKVTDI